MKKLFEGIVRFKVEHDESFLFWKTGKKKEWMVDRDIPFLVYAESKEVAKEIVRGWSIFNKGAVNGIDTIDGFNGIGWVLSAEILLNPIADTNIYWLEHNMRSEDFIEYCEDVKSKYYNNAKQMK